MTDIRPKAINSFLESQNIPETQLGILKSATTGVWQRAAKQSGPVASYTTGLSPKTPVPHYHLGSAAMYILKNGANKISEMPAKIKQTRAEKVAKAAYNPLNIFSDRRKR
jgi:hypothetical protein